MTPQPNNRNTSSNAIPQQASPNHAAPHADGAAFRGAAPRRGSFTPTAFPVSETAVPQADGEA